MLLINNAKIKLAFLPQLLNGNFTDFTNQWYYQVGAQLQVTMLVAAFMPYITFTLSYSIKYFSRKLDKCCLPQGFKTKRITIQ